MVAVQGQKAELQQMYQEWPFFQSTIDLIEMILSKCDMRIAAMYDAQLADTEEEKALGVVLRGKFDDTVKAVLEVGVALVQHPCLRWSWLHLYLLNHSASSYLAPCVLLLVTLHLTAVSSVSCNSNLPPNPVCSYHAQF